MNRVEVHAAPGRRTTHAGGPFDGTEPRLKQRWLVAARAGWLAVALLSVVFFVTSVPTLYDQLASFRDPTMGYPEAVRAGVARLGLSRDLFAATLTAARVAMGVAFIAVGTLIFGRRSAERGPLLISLTLVTFGAAITNTTAEAVAGHPVWGVVGDLLNFFGFYSFFALAYVFPDGRFVPAWTRLPATAWLTAGLGDVLLPGTPLNPDHWPLAFDLLMVGVIGTMLFAPVYRYRRVSSPVQRQQIKWVVFGLAVAITSFFGFALLQASVRTLREPGVPAAVYYLVGQTGLAIAFAVVPASIGIAILRYRLYDIDVLINRTLVYGALTACVVGLYVFVVVGSGVIFRTGDNVLISLLATGLVAVLFQPLRERLQRSVNRLLYGDRDDPYAVLTRLGQRLEATLEPDAVLPAVVGTITEALRLPYAAVALEHDARPIIVAEAGTPSRDLLRLPLTYQGETVGELTVAPRGPSEPFSPADRRLLEDLARQAGAAAHAVRLTADLQRARQRLVTAREEERRRLRRDLHDGLGPQLASQTFTLAAARGLLARDPTAVDTMLATLADQTQAAVTDIRRLVHDLRPPALDDLGLIGALRESATRYAGAGLTVTVEAPEPLPSLPAAAEVAAYRIAQEALQNVARHAHARHCVVRLTLDPAAAALLVEIQDDGRGLPADRRAGVGLASMRERADELGGTCVVRAAPGGGTQVSARLPLPPAEAS